MNCRTGGIDSTKNKFYDFIIYREDEQEEEQPKTGRTDDTGTRHGAPPRRFTIQMRHASRRTPDTLEPTQICKFISVFCFRGGFLVVCLFTLLIPIQDYLVSIPAFPRLSMVTAPTKESS